MRVQAAVVRAYGEPLRIEELDLVDPGPGEILVRLIACGVGRVDLEAISGALPMPLPFVPGSEGAGIVERIGGGVEAVVPGDTVFIAYAACGACESCRAGRPRGCVEFAARNLSGERPGSHLSTATGDIHGSFFGQSSFATHVICTASSAIKLPSEAPLEIVAAFGGDVATGAAAILAAFRLERGDSLAITGAGLVGLAACMVAKARGAQTIVIADPDEQSRALATECGATLVVADDGELATSLKSLTGDGAVFALDTTGSETGRDACRACLRPNGTLGGARPVWRDPARAAAVDASAGLDIDLQVAPHALILTLAKLYADGDFPIDRLVTFFPLDEVDAALRALADGSVPKPVLRFPVGVFDDFDRALSERDARDMPSPDVASEPDEVHARPELVKP